MKIEIGICAFAVTITRIAQPSQSLCVALAARIFSRVQKSKIGRKLATNRADRTRRREGAAGACRSIDRRIILMAARAL